MSEHSDSVHHLDCSGTLCPEPIVRTRRAIAALQPGELIEVVATDPLSEVDLAVFCERAGHELVHAETRDGQVRVRIRVNPAPKPGAG